MCCSTLATLPNIDFMYAGFNPKIGQPTLSSMKNPIFELSINNASNVTIQNNHYSIPFGMVIIDYPTEMKQSNTQVYISGYVLQQSLSESFSSSYNSWFLPGMYSSSETATFFKESVATSESYTAATTLVYTVYKATFENQSFNLTDEFANALNKLPDVYNEDTCLIFNKFFEMFGTHYVSTAIFGGSVNSRTSFSENMLQNYTIEQITEQINQQFIFWSESETLDYYQKQEYEELNLYYNSEFMLVGGDAYLFNASDYSVWEYTIIDQPVFVNIDLVPFYKLLPHNETNKINALNQAITDYFYDYYFDFGIISTAPSDLFGFKNNFAIINNLMYFLGSENNYIYNPVDNYWEIFERGPILDMAYFTCTSQDIYIYCFGGYSMSGKYEVSPVNIYNTETKIWLSFNPSVYFCGNYQSCYYLKENVYDEVYDYFSGGIANVINNYVYIFGTLWNRIDSRSPNCIIETQMIWVYDIDNNIFYTDFIWSDVGPNVNRPNNFQASVTTYNGFNYVIFLFAPIGCPDEVYNYCECPKGNYTNLVYGYIPCLNASLSSCSYWLYEENPMPEPLIGFSAINVDTTIYIIGGYNPYSCKYNSNIYSFNIETGLWSNIKSDSSATASLGIAMYLDKFLYYFGGSNGLNGSSFIENTVKLTSLIHSC